MIDAAIMLPLDYIDLEWNAPAECPSRDAVLEDAARVLSPPPEPGLHATARADVTQDDRGQWHAKLAVDSGGAHSERLLDAESCQVLATAAALIVAVAIEGKGPAQGTRAPAPAMVEPVPRVGLAKPPAPSEVLVAVSGLADWGLLPSAAPGGELALGWAYRAPAFRVRVLASASAFGDQTAHLPSAALEGGRFAAIGASARGCASLVKEALDVGLCFGVELDTMSATGFGPESSGFHSRPRTKTWPSPLASLMASYGLARHVAIALRTDGTIPLSPPTFGVLDSSGTGLTLHAPGPGLRIALGVEMRFF